MRTNLRHGFVKRALLLCAATNFSLGAFKITFGLLFGSLSVLADGLHSWADLLGDAFVISVSRYAHEPPDDAFSYGHMRIETLATVVFSFIIILIGIAISFETFMMWKDGRLPIPQSGLWLVPLISLVVNECIYHVVRRKAATVDSDLLRTAAIHQRLDAMTSTVVLISMILFFSGIHFADAIGAFLISVFILKHAGPLCFQNVLELIDRGASNDVLKQLHLIISSTPGVLGYHKLRTRFMAKRLIVDVHLDCVHTISVTEGHYIAEKVVSAVKSQLSSVLDVQVHVDPSTDHEIDSVVALELNREEIEKMCNSVFTRGLKNIQLHYLPSGIQVDVFLESQQDYDLSAVRKIIKENSEIKSISIHQCLHTVDDFIDEPEV